jgi:dienelactone hydrolase
MQLQKYLGRLVVCLFLMGCGSDSPVDVTQETAEFVDIQAISFSTSDGFEIVGSWFTSSHKSGQQPVVILVHTFDQNHLQWLPLIPDLVTLGYHVLAYDIRGHGQSTFKDGQYSPLSQFELEDFDSMPLDVGGAISWLKGRPEVDANRIAVVGADIGANIAFVSSGSFSDVKTAVSISPVSISDQLVLLGEGIPDFQPRSVLFMAAFGDGYAYTSSEALADQTQSPKRVSGYQGSANGLTLLDILEARAELIQWLSDNL